MNISDLLDPEKMKELDERFKPIDADDIDRAEKTMKERGERYTRPRVRKTK